ncbi:hypothetical protein FACS189431_5150 [Alphaproteobacteria bacterium]|nr:hypothetical protein FACS189431_5150 [Alphaproteobacteria bacterium]
MKKIKILAFTLLLAGFTACDLDVNTDPNYPADVEPSLVFPSAELAVATVVGDGMYNYAGFFAQYYDQMPEANQYNTLVEYNFLESNDILQRPYRNLYAGALADLKQITEKSTNTSDIYAATVLRVLAFQLLVDNLDKVPYTEALQGSAIPAPKWDDGQTVYAGVLQELDEAEAALINTPLTVNDLIFNKNLRQWEGFANALRLRMYLRFIDANVDAANYTNKLRALVDANRFFTGDVKLDVFADEANKRNPWYSTNRVGLAINHVAGYPIVTYLLSTNDPRIEYNFVKATNSGEFAGELPGSKQQLTSKRNADYSFLKYYATKPVYYFTQSELQFLLSEVYLRFYNDDTKAKAAYEAGIDADFAARGLSGASTLYGAGGSVAWSRATTPTAKLELVYMQKWVALCYMDHMEAWSEIRRTDVPKLSALSARAIYDDPTIYTSGELISPMQNALGGGLIKRMHYPLDPRQLNVNTPPMADLKAPVWWDIK